MSFTLELFSPTEIPKVLAECRRVLRSDGRIGVVTMSGLGPENVVTRLYRWASRRFPGVVDCRPILLRETMTVAGLQARDAELVSIVGLPVEIVLALKV